MPELSAKRASTRVRTMVKAERRAVYRAFLDPHAMAAWLSPDNMTGHVHAFTAREGGRFRMTLRYQDPEHAPGGKTTEDTDTFQGRFVELVPYEKIVEVVEFKSQDAAFRAEMGLTARFVDADGGTEITILSEDIPAGIRPEDNELGCQESLEKLAALLE
jgi:uncharacterized protein YndB with AHSA1/START domain